MRKTRKVESSDRWILSIPILMIIAFAGFAGLAIQNHSMNSRLDVIELRIGEIDIAIKEKINFPEETQKSIMEVLEQESVEEKQAELAVADVKETATVEVESKKPQSICHEWMTQAGITNQEVAYKLIMKESSCNPNAVNKSSGACGIGQQLPCGKWKHTWNDPVGAMIDMQEYVFNRYGSWENALAFHLRNNWY